MFMFRWIFRLIKAALFGALCGAGGFMGGVIVFGILQLFCGWSKESTDTIIWICAIIAALWAVVTIIRNGIEDDADRQMFDSYKKAYEDVTGEKYTYVPTLESIGKQYKLRVFHTTIPNVNARAFLLSQRNHCIRDVATTKNFTYNHIYTNIFVQVI